MARLICIGGLSGTGKSTLSRRLAGELSAVWLRSDAVRKELWGVAPETKLPPEAYSSAFNEKTYKEVNARAETALRAGRTVILDVVFAKAEGRAQARELARDCGADFTGLWLEAPADILRTRVDTRTGDVSDADSRIVDQQLTYDLGVIDWVRVDEGGTPEQTYQQARRILTY
jgi:hypothetical protein